MSEPPELWAFVVANLIMFGFGAVLTGLSYLSYRSNDRTSTFRNATMGFGLITIGGLSEPVYQLALKGDYNLSGRELLALQTIEGTLLALGLGVLFYSIYRHDRRPQKTELRTGSIGVSDEKR